MARTVFCHVDCPKASISICDDEYEVFSINNVGKSRKLISVESDELIAAYKIVNIILVNTILVRIYFGV